MFAAVLHAPGLPEALQIEEVPVPAIGPNDVLLRVRACGVSYRDIVERNGTYRRDVTFPSIMGIEISGEVAAIGDAVTMLAVGDHVASKAFSSCGQCRYCRTGRETTCRKRKPVRGGYGEYSAIPEDALVRVPHDMPFEIACLLGPGAGVALNAVRDTAHVTIGDSVLVTGASGGVGLPAVQLARMAGARVFAITRSEDKRAMLEAAGATDVIVAGTENYGRAIRAMTGGEGVDVVIDTVGSAAFDAAFDALAPHGRYAFVGQLNADTITINPARIFFKRAHLIGVGSVSRVQLEDVIALAASGHLQPRIARVMLLAEIAEAHRLAESAELSGRIVVTP